MGLGSSRSSVAVDPRLAQHLARTEKRKWPRRTNQGKGAVGMERPRPPSHEGKARAVTSGPVTA
eukprot:1553012-Amphidinium_carterae.1